MAAQQDKRIIVYPSYINSKCTVAQGRRIPAAAACETPNVHEMADCCKALKIPAEIEAKHYPREWRPFGRLRVQLLQDDGTPVNPDVPTRRALMLKMAEMVPKHVGRVNKKGAGKAEAASSSSSSAVAAGSSSKQSGKKGGKKKK